MATVSANTELYDKIVDRAAMIRLYERRVQGKVSLVLDGHTVKLDDLISGAETSTAGLKKLREAIDQELQKTYQEIFNISKRSLLDLVVDQASFSYQVIENTMGGIWTTQRPTRRVAEDIVLDRPLYNDKTLLQGWNGVSLAERRRIETVIRAGIAKGSTVKELALAVRRGNVHSISRNQAEALVTTSITSVHAQADHAVYEANGKALHGWQYVAVLDSRTTPICAHRDGTIYQISEKKYLPPAHYRCRSTTIPVFKSWEDLAKLEGVAEVRKTNIANLTDKQKTFYDGLTPLRESYDAWLRRQPTTVQLKHLGDYKKLEMFQTGQLTVDKFTNDKGNSLGIKELRRLTSDSTVIPGDTRRFANAKERLDAMQLGAVSPDDFLTKRKLKDTLVDYFLLQAGELDGTLSSMNYRGGLVHTKLAMRRKVLSSPPTEDQLRFNPATGRYEDIRLYQPNPAVYENRIRLLETAEGLTPEDITFVKEISSRLENKMSINQRAVVVDNLRVIFSRYRKNPEPWGNFKAVVQAQLKFDIMNVSEAVETHIRRDTNVLKKLLDDNYIDPVLGPTQLDELHDQFLENIVAKNRWEDRKAPKIAKELKGLLNLEIPLLVRDRLTDADLQQFYLRFAHRLALADSPDRDQFAVALGRDLYNMANLNGAKRDWYTLGLKLLESKRVSKFYKVETFGVQKRRMKSRMSGSYFGPYYDTLAHNIRVVDPRIQEYARLTRKVELGLRVSVTSEKNRLKFRTGYKTYFIDRGILGLEDTRIPITSTSSFSDFPEELVDADLVKALNWAGASEYRIDEDYYDFIHKLIYFEDDRGKAKYYNELNHYRNHLLGRGDAYERLKAMEWLRASGKSFSNHPFVDHRVRIYERGLIGPQAGETFRPFLNTKELRTFSPQAFNNLQDQIGGFLGGLDEYFEGRYNSLSFTGRQKIANAWRPEMVRIGNLMLRNKPGDIRAFLESDMVQRIDGEELGKFARLAIESAKLDNYLKETSTKVYQATENFGLKVGPNLYLNVNKLLRETRDLPTETVDLDDIWFEASKLKSKRDRVRIKDANPNVSVILAKLTDPEDLAMTGGKQYVRLDGIHRIAKAKELGQSQISAKIVDEDTFNAAKMDFMSVIKDNGKISLRGKPINPYSPENLEWLYGYKTGLALEQDASSSGAQIIALTTKNKQLAELSNVVATTQKRRLYDEIAATTYNDPRFQLLNRKLGLNERDLRKAAKAQNMVTFYGAGERTGIFNVEGKLAKVLNKDTDTLVVTARDRDAVLDQISARAARVERYDKLLAEDLKQLRADVRDVFNKGLDPGDEILEQLYFLDPKTRELVEKLSSQYERIITPNDFKVVANIMSEHLADQVPILKDFTKFFGRLAEAYLANAKPSKSNFDWSSIIKSKIFGNKKKGYILPDEVSKLLGLKPGEPVKEAVLKRISLYNPNSGLADMINGVSAPETRRTGGKYFKVELFGLKTLFEIEILKANKLPKSWTNVPWINFDGKVIEQNFTQSFEERLVYKDKDGNWTTNILQVPQKTEASWWDQALNKSGKINDIADATKARTAFAVNGNHSNDATLVKQFHLWGAATGVPTSTIHDAFFTNAADMLQAREALRKIYARALKGESVKKTLDEMRARGLPKEVYDKFLEEAIEKGLIPVVGKSRIGGRLIDESDILTTEDILQEVPSDFVSDYGWYGVG